MDKSNSSHIALFIGTLAGGGAERVILNLSGEFIKHGKRVDLLVTRNVGPLSGSVPTGVRVIELKKDSWLKASTYLVKLPIENWFDLIRMIFSRRPKVARRLPSLIDYLHQENPAVILSTLDSVNLISLWAKFLIRSKVKFVIRQAIFQSQEIANSSKYFESKLLPKLVKRWYPTADNIVSVSKHMTNDLRRYCNIPADKIITIYNPVNLLSINELVKETVNDDWFLDDEIPVILSVGRLDKQKDYSTLFAAVKIVSKKMKVRLVILGEGVERKSLEKSTRALEIDKFVFMPGHVANPYKYMARSDVFVLSSMWEGLPNVLIEAMACGCSIVSTNCPSGPEEILEKGRLGQMATVGSASSIADGIMAVLGGNKLDKQILVESAQEYALEKIAQTYMKTLFS